MRRIVMVPLLAGLLLAQDGGRDTGRGAHPVIFLRWRRSAESAEIYRAAWRALEPHFGLFTRRRLMDFEGDAKRAGRILHANADASIAVVFGNRTADLARDGLRDSKTVVVEVSWAPDAQVRTLVDRERFGRLLRRFAPKARKVAVWSPRTEALAGWKLQVEDPQGCDLAWVGEGAEVDLRALRKRLEKLRIPLVVTDSRDAVAAMTVRPDPAGVGRALAAAVLHRLRSGKMPVPAILKRLHVAVDLGAARAAGFTVPLDLLARADQVRRAP